MLGQPACSQTPQRSPPPARPASWATLAAHVSHFPGTPLALPPRARPPPPCPPPRLCAACVPGKSLLGASAGRTVFPLSPPSLSDRLFSDAGLARTRTALLLPRWGSTSPAGKRPCPHLSDILLIFFSPFSDIRPLRARSRSLAVPRSQHLVRSGHRGASPAPPRVAIVVISNPPLPHVSLRFPRGPFIHFISVFHLEGFSC